MHRVLAAVLTAVCVSGAEPYDVVIYGGTSAAMSAAIQSVRMGRWHAFRPHPAKPMELYDIVGDPACENDRAAERADVVEKIARIMKEARTPSEWYINPGESPESIAAKKERAKLDPIPAARRANGI